jgi:hypothetical protein
MAEGYSSETLTPKPAGLSSTAPLHKNTGPHPTECRPTSNGIHNRAAQKG